MAHIYNSGNATVSTDPNTINALDSDHQIKIAILDDGTKIWKYVHDNPSGNRWVEVDKNITISAGTGLSGGGDLSSNRTIGLSTATQSNIAKGVTAHGWGNHSQEGYLTSLPTHNHDSDYVMKSGDTMMGNLEINGQLHINGDEDHRFIAGSFNDAIGNTVNSNSLALLTRHNATIGSDNITQIWSGNGGTTIFSKGIPTFFIESNSDNAKVGVGTINPSEKLEVIGNVLSESFIKSGGTSLEFLKADGSVDSSNYITGLSWSELTGKPSTFPPSSHTHANLTAGTGISGSTYNGGTARTFNFDTVWGDGRYLSVSGQSVDSDKLDGQHGSYYLNYNNLTNTPPDTTYVGKYSSPNGFLVKTNVARTENSMLVLHIKGNSYGGRVPINTLVQVYNYVSSDAIIQTGALNNGYRINEVKAFYYNNLVYFWVPQQNGYQTMTFQLLRMEEQVNRVVSVTNAEVPSSGVEKMVNIIPQTAWFENTLINLSQLNNDSGYATQSWASGQFEPKFSKNTAFNKNFGTAAGTVAQGNHVHSWSQITGKPSTFTPSAHTHGNISNDGKIGTATSKVITTSTGGLLVASNQGNAFNKNFGTIAGTVAQGNDSRFHSHSNMSVLQNIAQANINQWNTAYNNSVSSLTFDNKGLLKLTKGSGQSYSNYIDTFKVKDVRTEFNNSTGSASWSPLPSDTELDKTVKAYFAGDWGGDDSWGGVLNVKGWSGSYSSWQLAGTAHSSDNDKNLYYRTGSGSTWREWRKVILEDTPIAPDQVTVKVTANTSNNLNMGYPAGNLCNMASANPITMYYTFNSKPGGQARVRINAASEPGVSPNGVKLKGSTFVANTDMYLEVRNNGVRTEYWFEAM